MKWMILCMIRSMAACVRDERASLDTFRMSLAVFYRSTQITLSGQEREGQTERERERERETERAREKGTERDRAKMWEHLWLTDDSVATYMIGKWLKWNSAHMSKWVWKSPTHNNRSDIVSCAVLIQTVSWSCYLCCPCSEPKTHTNTHAHTRTEKQKNTCTPTQPHAH